MYNDAYSEMVAAGHKEHRVIAQALSTTALSFSHRRADGTPEEITSIRVDNYDTSISVSYSVDGGTSFKNVFYMAETDEKLSSVFEIQIKSASGTPSVNLFYTTRQ